MKDLWPLFWLKTKTQKTLFEFFEAGNNSASVKALFLERSSSIYYVFRHFDMYNSVYEHRFDFFFIHILLFQI